MENPLLKNYFKNYQKICWQYIQDLNIANSNHISTTATKKKTHTQKPVKKILINLICTHVPAENSFS